MLGSRLISCTMLGKMWSNLRLFDGMGAGVIFRPGLQVPPPSIERLAFSFSTAKPLSLDSEMIISHTMGSMHLPNNHLPYGVRSRLAACVSAEWARVRTSDQVPGALSSPSSIFLCFLPLAVVLRCLYCIYFQISFQTYPSGTMSPSKMPSITNGVNGHDLSADYPDPELQTGPYRVLDQYHSKRTRLRVASIGAGASGSATYSFR